MCLMNYCSFCMHFELFYFRNLKPVNYICVILCMYNYKLHLTEDDIAKYLCSLKIQSL